LFEVKIFGPGLLLVYDVVCRMHAVPGKVKISVLVSLFEHTSNGEDQF
jgi:ABC-type enterochelin transport system permease subunit